MEKVTKKELAHAVCELLARCYDEGAGEDRETETLINRYFAEVYPRATFLDYYQRRASGREAIHDILNAEAKDQ